MDLKELHLSHPARLVSLTLRNVKIENIKSCINLRNLYSEYNLYKLEDIESLFNIKKIYSSNDKYKNNGSHFLVDMFKRN